MEKHKIQVRRGTLAEWSSLNPTLASGEVAFTTDTRQLKIGDGSNPWNNRNFVSFDGGCLDCSSSSSLSSSSSSSILNTTIPPNISSSSSSSQTSCPAPWMKILMADGTLVEAGRIRKGDRVHTRNEDTMEWGDYEVTVAQTVMSERIRLVIGNTEFVCSPSHKFRDGNGWTTAEQLRRGNRLEGLEIKDVSEEAYGEVVKLTVDKAHTYVCEGLLSHNKSEIINTSSSSQSNCDPNIMCFVDNSNCGEPSILSQGNQPVCGSSYDTIGPGGPCRVEIYPLTCEDFKCTYQFNNASKTWELRNGHYKSNLNNFYSLPESVNCSCNCPSDPGLPQGAPDELAQINTICSCP